MMCLFVYQYVRIELEKRLLERNLRNELYLDL